MNREPLVIESDDLAERSERLSRLLSIAKLEMTNLYQQVANSGYAILLTDSDGVVLNYVGDPRFNDTAARSGLHRGAVWTEAAQGTNGMGTCLIERKPLVIHHTEHFFAKHTGLTCSSAPIFDPHGSMVAVLDASSESSMAQQHTMVLVNMSAQMIENRVFLCTYKDNYIARFHSRPEFVSTLGEGTLAFDAAGRILSANRSAMFQLGIPSLADIIGRSISETFNLPLNALMDLATKQPFQPIPLHCAHDGRRFFAIVQRPERDHATRVALSSRAPAPSRERSAQNVECPLDHLEFGDIQMRRNIRQAKKILGRNIPVILYGETGTGKGLFARNLHMSGPFAEKPFVAVNCASIPETLIESELFGYKPGAFTGASRQGSRGKIVQANGGTLFLDEIGDMPLALQARLLRVLEEKEVVPLGGDAPVKVDINIISATHRALQDLIAEGRFREDLYYRLHGIAVSLPPLRDRSDKEPLIKYLIRQEAPDDACIEIDPEAMRVLTRYRWPGNIRQLCNALRTMLALCETGRITLDDLPQELHRVDEPLSDSVEQAPELSCDDDTENPLAAAEKMVLLRQLGGMRWNVTKVARQLNMSRNSIYRKMKRYGIKPPR